MNINVKYFLDLDDEERKSILNVLNNVFPDYDYNDKSFSQWCIDNKIKIFYTNINESIIGVLSIHLEKGRWVVSNFGVLNEYRGNGVGSMLFKEVQKQYPKFYLEVDLKNYRALDFYLKKGGVVIEENDEYYVMYFERLSAKS